MHTATVRLKSVSAYSQSAPTESKKKSNESHEDHENRIWRERMHKTKDGYVFIPAMAFKNSLAQAGKWLGRTIPGKGKSTYTKRIEAGIMVLEDMVLDIKYDDVACERLFVPSDGIRGGGKRVWKNFPLIPEWEGTVVYTIIDDVISKEAFREHLEQSGMFVGLGRFRPSSNGTYGRFSIKKLDWE
jgi:hypothetical protein